MLKGRGYVIRGLTIEPTPTRVLPSVIVSQEAYIAATSERRTTRKAVTLAINKTLARDVLHPTIPRLMRSASESRKRRRGVVDEEDVVDEVDIEVMCDDEKGDEEMEEVLVGNDEQSYEIVYEGEEAENARVKRNKLMSPYIDEEEDNRGEMTLFY
jgi:hypothetical protein